MRPGFALFLFVGMSMIVWHFLATFISVKYPDSPIGQAASMVL